MSVADYVPTIASYPVSTFSHIHRSKVMRYSKIRSFVGTAILLGIFAAAFFGYPLSGCNYLPVSYIRLFCPVGFIENSLSSHSIAWKLLPGFLIVCTLVLLWGRAYCSWFCPATHAKSKSLGFVAAFLPNSLKRRVGPKWRAARQKIVSKTRLEAKDGIALVLGGAVGIAIFHYPFFCLWCPIGIISRSLVELATHYTLRSELVLLVVPLGLGLLFKSGWKCLCPVGLFRGVVALGNRSVVPSVAQDTCKACGKCEKVCPSEIAVTKTINTMECIKCFKCVDTCPYHAASVRLFRTRR